MSSASEILQNILNSVAINMYNDRKMAAIKRFVWLIAQNFNHIEKNSRNLMLTRLKKRHFQKSNLKHSQR